tara:strand:- start:1160 stop:1945 length:786 start_codon:yes stop_codon:yes gene_type:complete
MTIKFEKWHGNGNDFVIVNSIESEIKINKSFIKKISNRNKGIGFDQLIYVCLPSKDNHDFFLRFFNTDGSEAEMCLNGARCASRYIWNNSFAPLKKTSFLTRTKLLSCFPRKGGGVSVNIDLPSNIDQKNILKKIQSKLKDEFFLSNIGNNHLCIKMKSIQKIDLNKIYMNLKGVVEDHKINVSIYRENEGIIDIRTYENGVGETLSCGSASSCIASHVLSKNNKPIKIRSIGGELIFKKTKDGILMTGPTSFIYKGNINE